ncbi:MAG TPA: S8 family serine peptidase [Saprospiraceae bacterium]|nr:S8 family serine peptidase [Saprospiraceae bacterium]
MPFQMFVFAVLFSMVSYGQSAYVHPTIYDKLEQRTEVDVIVLLKEKADFPLYRENWSKEEKSTYVFQQLSTLAAKSQKSLCDHFNKLGLEHQSFWIVNAIRVKINQSLLQEIASNPNVKAIFFDEPFSNNLGQDLSFNKMQQRAPEITWGLTRIGADKVWQMGFEGQGVTLAGEDTGYKWDLEGIKEKYRGWNGTSVDHNYNWHDGIHTISVLSADSLNPCGLSLKEPCDDNGHGTHTAGTMVGSTTDNLYGVAPKAKWIGCRNMERGNGAPSTYIECFQFFLAPTDLDGKNPKPELAPHAINNSWYCSQSEGCNASNYVYMEEVINNLKKAGIVVVVSAGNDGVGCGTISNPPAMFENSFTVGSFASNDTISGFSSAGPVRIDSSGRIKPNVVAPGSYVISRTLSGELQGWFGTSMAGPHVAGLVALIISAHPALAGQVEKIETIIELSARPDDAIIDCEGLVNSARPNHVYGYGKIQADAAVKMALLLKIEEEQRMLTGFTISPNPASDLIKLEFMNDEYRTIQVYDLLGHLLIEKIITQKISLVSISDLPKGICVFKVKESGLSRLFLKI